MLAIIQDVQSQGRENKSKDYFFLMLAKVALDALILSFWRRSVHRSFLGISSLFIFAADLLLLSAVGWLCFCAPSLHTSVLMCVILSHSSAVYSQLPIPTLLCGALDYMTYNRTGLTRTSHLRTMGYCVVVFLIWALACLYSYYYNNADLLETQYNSVEILVCPVEDSTLLSHFSALVCVFVAGILLLYCRGLLDWLQQANKLAKVRDPSLLKPQSDLAFTYCMLDELHKDNRDTTVCRRSGQRHKPPLFVSLTLCFTLNWTPYLLMCIACDILGFLVPSYTTVNLLWMACSNSLLTGLTFWYRSKDMGPYVDLQDDVCSWSLFWHLSKETVQSVAAFTTSDKAKEGLLEV